MHYMRHKSSPKHTAHKTAPLNLIKSGIASISIGAALLGFVSPAFADTKSDDLKSLQEQLVAASKTLEDAKANLRDKKAAMDKVAQYQAEGSAGYFKFVGASGAYKVLTDPSVNGKLAESIKLGNAQDATNLDNMIATMKQIERSNELRKSEGKPELKVSDTLMAMAQADVNWASSNIAHPQQFNIGENLYWGNEDPFTSWYDQEKAAHQHNLANPDAPKKTDGHYLNIINESYDITGFALTQHPNNEYGDTYGQTFFFAAATRGSIPAEYSRSTILNGSEIATFSPDNSLPVVTTGSNDSGLYAGSRTLTVPEYMASLKSYQQWISHPKTDIENAEKVVNEAQSAYDAIVVKINAIESDKSGSADNSKKSDSSPSGKPSHDSADSDGSNDPRSQVDPSSKQTSRTSEVSTSEPMLAMTGSNILGALALTLGFGLTATGTFVLRRKNR